MAKKTRSDQIGRLIKDVEAVTKRLRTTVSKRTAALPKDLKVMAARLRKQAANAAAQVEKYAHEVRLELEGNGRKTAKPKRRRRRSKPAAAPSAPAWVSH